MRVVLSLFVGMIGIVTGYCLAVTVGYWIAGLAGMSDFEGGRGMFAGFILGPVGAVVGLVAGCIGGWKLGAGRLSPNGVMLLLLFCLFAIGVVWETLVLA